MDCFFCIDLKSFYASVECVERGFDPLLTNLVVADESRTEKTICLAISPMLKSKIGVGGRARLFEVIQACERYKATYNEEVKFVAAKPRMALYIEYSARIYDIYLKYFSKEDIHVYSIDEVFIDASTYLDVYKVSPKELLKRVILDIFDNTGITATGGIGTNLYLAKISMDIVAKRTSPDSSGVRIAYLDETLYRKLLWSHEPITDFWRVGGGTARRLSTYGIRTMGDIARVSISEGGEDFLYKLFGINAELLIDHAWGYEPCTMNDIKKYKPNTNSISSGQVLTCPYKADKARLIVREMIDLLVLDLVKNNKLTRGITLGIGYDVENVNNNLINFEAGDLVMDHYGRVMPRPSHGSINLKEYTLDNDTIVTNVMKLFDKVIVPEYTVRRIHLSAEQLVDKDAFEASRNSDREVSCQVSIFDMISDNNGSQDTGNDIAEDAVKKTKLQQTILDLKVKYGKNAILRGMNLEEGAMTIERNSQIGGHSS